MAAPWLELADDEEDPMIGQRIAERYTVTEILGEGGMGIVYGAIHDDLEREVAIKVVKHAGLSRETIERFRRETITLSGLGHPNIVAIYDVGRLDDGRPYMVMPRLAGRDLGDDLERGRRFYPGELAALLEGPAKALDLMHARGLIHRDIKPENLIVEQLDAGQTVVKLVDFGLVSALDRNERRLTREGFVSGTPEYLPPESVQGDVSDGRGDVYSLAVVIFELLSGELPFTSDRVFEIMMHKAQREPPTLASVGYPASPALEAVIARGLARLPDERYSTATALVRALADVAETMSSAPPPRAPSPVALVPAPAVARVQPDTGVENAGLENAGLENAGREHAGPDSTGLENPRLDGPSPRRSGISPSLPRPAAVPREAGAFLAPHASASVPPLPTHGAGLARTLGGLAVVAALLLIALLLVWRDVDEAAPPTEVAPGPTVSEDAPLVLPPDDELDEGETSELASDVESAPNEVEPSEARAETPPSGDALDPPRVLAPRVPARNVRAPAAEAPATPDVPRVATPEPDLAAARQLSDEATRALLAGQLAQAVETYRRATLAAPSYGPAWRGLGLSFERLSRPADARRAYQRYLRGSGSASDADAIRARLDALPP